MAVLAGNATYAPTGVTTNAQQIVNARILAEIALQFNIGADILGKGNRFVEKFLGAEKMSGDTVMVPVVGGGKVFHKLDLSGEDLSVSRDAVPVSVGPLSTAAAVDQETLTLSIKNPDIMAKRVAQLALEASNMAYKCLRGNALNTTVIATNDIVQNNGFNGRNKIYDIVALSEASKMVGETYGVVHPLVWSKLIAMFQGNYAPNEKEGSALYKNELGELAGIRWTKTQILELITGKDLSSISISLDYTNVFNQGDYDVQAPDGVPSYLTTSDTAPFITIEEEDVDTLFENKTVGALSLPFSITGVYSTDVFGNPTGRLATFHLVATTVAGNKVTKAKLAGPVFFEGPRQNVYSADYSQHKLQSKSLVNVLTANTQYLPPALVWKRDDFLVAVKGLEKFYGMDSMTVPTSYRDKGILPLRGLAWTDPVQASTIFRVDVLLGCAAFLRNSMASVYIQAN